MLDQDSEGPRLFYAQKVLKHCVQKRACKCSCENEMQLQFSGKCPKLPATVVECCCCLIAELF